MPCGDVTSSCISPLFGSTLYSKSFFFKSFSRFWYNSYRRIPDCVLIIVSGNHLEEVGRGQKVS